MGGLPKKQRNGLYSAYFHNRYVKGSDPLFLNDPWHLRWLILLVARLYSLLYIPFYQIHQNVLSHT